MNDQQAAELISQSLAGALSAEDQSELEAYLHDQPDARNFAQLSRVIQQATLQQSTASEHGEEHNSQLSDVSKERMRRAVAEAVQQAHRQTPAARVAEASTEYYSGPHSAAAEETRQTNSRFTLIRKIGEGGLGTVWLARDERLRRNVALKELKAASADAPQLWRRFQREAEITGQLEHPNVVPLYISGVNPETDMPFYAMRFLGKQTLSDAIYEYHARRTVDGDKSIHLHRLLTAFLDVCQAIAYAHARGVIHRDLKPENVALDSFGQVLVLDWGLAKLTTEGELATRLALSGSDDDDSGFGHTFDGDVLGTPLYMAPEQAAGELDLLDERTDVYGLGAILYAILTGVAPHENSSKSHQGSGRVADLLKSIVQTAPPKPREVNPDVPRDLEAICLRAMCAERFARYTSAQDLASEVEGWIAGKHQRQARYDSMRMTGSDLKSRMCVQIRQLVVTAQFMVELPPIQGLLSQVNQELSDAAEYALWRERLSTILLALAKTKSNLTGLSYAQVSGDRINELVRVERSLQDGANIRGLPASRLRKGAANTFHKLVMQQFPGECVIDIDLTVAGSSRIVAGVPVFDAATEEPFGLVLAESEVGSLVKPELNAIDTSHVVYLVDDHEHVLFSSKPGYGRERKMAPQLISRWSEIAQTMASAVEYIESDLEYYATRLSLPQDLNSLRVILQAN